MWQPIKERHKERFAWRNGVVAPLVLCSSTTCLANEVEIRVQATYASIFAFWCPSESGQEQIEVRSEPSFRFSASGHFECMGSICSYRVDDLGVQWQPNYVSWFYPFSQELRCARQSRPECQLYDFANLGCLFSTIESDTPFWTAVGSTIEGGWNGIPRSSYSSSHDQGFAFTLCREDFDASGIIDFGDLAILLMAWGADFERPDLDSTGLVDNGDLAVLLLDFGSCVASN